MIRATTLWIHQVVIRLGLCPWAAKDVQNTQIRVFQEESSIQYGLLAFKETQTNVFNFAKELAFDQPHCHSGMAIIPQLQNFPQYLQFTDEFVEMLKTTGLESLIQIATFHPKFQFENTEEEDAENWTSRSPFPTIHLLKVAEVSAAIEAYPGSTDKIWERNIRVLRKIGAESLEQSHRTLLKEAVESVSETSDRSQPEHESRTQELPRDK
jgi:uncharacterized protein